MCLGRTREVVFRHTQRRSSSPPSRSTGAWVRDRTAEEKSVDSGNHQTYLRALSWETVLKWLSCPPPQLIPPRGSAIDCIVKCPWQRLAQPPHTGKNSKSERFSPIPRGWFPDSLSLSLCFPLTPQCLIQLSPVGRATTAGGSSSPRSSSPRPRQGLGARERAPTLMSSRNKQKPRVQGSRGWGFCRPVAPKTLQARFIPRVRKLGLEDGEAGILLGRAMPWPAKISGGGEEA